MEINLKELDIKIEEVKNRISRNEEAIKKVKDEYIRSNGPAGYKSGTSYLDADTIHGSRNVISAFEYVDRLRVLENLIYLDKIILENYEEKKKNLNIWKDLSGIQAKVFYLHKIVGMPLEEVAEELDRSYQHIRRVSAGINNNIKNAI